MERFKRIFKIYLLALVWCLGIAELDAHIKSEECDPYYASIKSSRANSHKGPGKEYKISFEYVKPGTPVVILAKYDHWRKIRDPEGDVSWIHKSLLSPKRFVITINKEPVKLMSASNDSAQVLALVKKNVVMKLQAVSGKWCNVSVTSNDIEFKGWIKKTDVFGVFENEIC